MIDNFWLRDITNGDTCYETMPIYYKYNNITREAFLDISTMTIVSHSMPRRCSSITSVFVTDKSDEDSSILLWTGSILKKDKLDVYPINFVSPIPTVKNIDIQYGNIYDPAHEAINSYLQVAQTVQSVYSITEVLNGQSHSIDEADLSVLGEHVHNLGMDVTDFFARIPDAIWGWFSPILIIVQIIIVVVIVRIVYKLCSTTKIISKVGGSIRKRVNSRRIRRVSIDEFAGSSSPR